MKKRIFSCPICKKNHSLEFPDDFAKNRPKYPFSYIYLHQYQGDTNEIEMKGKNVLTTLYIDANLKIRGVEAVMQDKDADILSKEEALKMVDMLTTQITELQESYNELLKKYNKLKE